MTSSRAHLSQQPSEAALEYEQHLVRLARLMAAGRGDAEEADAEREAMEGPWDHMSAEEQQLMRHLSSELYMLEQDEMPEEGSAGRKEVESAWKTKDYRLLLSFLRKHPDWLAEHAVAYLRGIVWGELGYEEAGLAFMTYAADTAPQNGNYTYLALVSAMELEHVEEALARATAIELREDAPTRSLIAAAHALLRFTSAEALRHYERAAALFNRAIYKESARPVEERFTGMLTEAYVGLGVCHELRGDVGAALTAYSDALKVDPRSDVALIARGFLLMSSDEAAAERDFKLAVETKTPVVWPYLYLAPIYLRRQEYSGCIELCHAALQQARDQADEQRANFYEWSAIARAHMQASRAVVDELFALAVERAPLNPRIDQNRHRLENWDVDLDTSLDEGRRRFQEAITQHPPVLAVA